VLDIFPEPVLPFVRDGKETVERVLLVSDEPIERAGSEVLNLAHAGSA